MEFDRTFMATLADRRALVSTRLIGVGSAPRRRLMPPMRPRRAISGDSGPRRTR
jgi:hypothetical protein